MNDRRRWIRIASVAGAAVLAPLVLHVAGGEATARPAESDDDPDARAKLVPRRVEEGALRQDVLDFRVYREEIEPIFLADRGGGYGPGQSACVTCHVRSGTPLKLQPLQSDGSGGVYWTEAQSRMNFATVARLVTPGDPMTSRLLREPLAMDGGGSRLHVGGKFWDSIDDPEWRTIAAWVSAAEPAGMAVASAPALDFEFFRSCVQRIFLDREDETDRMECAACHGGGSRGFAQELPEGRDYWNEEESRANYGLVMEYIEPGFPLRSRFLTHPLDPHAGGDNYHSGGRRWRSQDDPEWQMLAAWVRGEPTSCAVTDR